MLLGLLLAVAAGVGVARAQTVSPFTAFLALRGNAGFASHDSAYAGASGSPLWDDSGNFRLIFDDALDPHRQAEIHNDLGFAAGDVLAATNRIAPTLFAGAPASGPDDRRRLFDLTHDFARTDRSLAYDRLDRLNLRWSDAWGSVTVGRTAITWGNGLVFNVQDLFNPFDPRDIARNYKTGDDLALVETHAGANTWQFLVVPRRNPVTGDIAGSQSSFAVHGHIPVGGTEWTVLAASHYHEWLAGAGRVVTVGGAVWRSDVLLTRLENGGTAFAAVTNMDYSWTWFGRNCYGLVEAYFNSLGASDPTRAFSKPELAARLARGELFTLGRSYLATSLEVELHPLLHGAVSTILDLQGPSAVVQPRLVWDARRDLQVTLGAELNAGAPGTEYGGPVDPATGRRLRSPQTLFLWLEAWF